MESVAFERQLIVSLNKGKSESESAILSLIYTNPFVFFLNTLDEDDVSEFLLFLRAKLCGILQNFDSEKGNIFPYFRASIFKVLLSYKREKARTFATDIATFQNSCEDWEETDEDKNDEMCEESDQHKRYFTSEKASEAKQKRFRSLILCLGLKSAYYLEDEHIHKIANFTGTKFEKILAFVSEIKEMTIRRNQKRLDSLAKINIAYTKKRRCEWQLSRLDEGDARFDAIKEKLKKQNERWKKQVEELRKISLVPSNAEIAKVLKKTKRQVELIMQGAHKLMNEKGIKY